MCLKLRTKSIVSLMVLSMAVGGTAVIATVAATDAAYANNGQGKGNGAENGHGKAREETNSNRGQDRKAEREQIMQDAGVQNWGAIASELGQFNKAHANIEARLNSSDPVHQALGAYELTGGITTSGVTAYNDAKMKYESYKADLIGTSMEDTLNPGTMVEITEENVDQYADSFENYSGLSEDLIEAYGALSALDGFRDEPLTSGAIDALNSMLELEEPASE